MELSAILSWHLHHYPLLQAEDIYKLIFQGIWGPGHLLTDVNKARKLLFQEIKNAALPAVAKNGNIIPTPEEIEPVDPAGLLIRVNLARFNGAEEKGELLFQALIKTTQEFVPQPGLLPVHFNLALQWTAKHLPQQAERLKHLKSIPPRHSGVYIKNYRPAYRVILSRLWSRF